MKRWGFLKRMCIPTMFGIFVPAIAMGQGLLINRFFNQTGAAGGGATYLVEEDCEGTGTPASWTDSGTTIDWDFTGTVLAGAQSVQLSSQNARILSPTFAAQANLRGYFLYRADTLLAASVTICAFIGPGVSAEVRTDGTLRIGGSVNSPTTVATMVADTTYHVWVQYIKGTGANAVYSVAFSTTGTKPTSGDNFTSATTGTETTDCTALRLHCESSLTATVIFDKIRADDADIGDSPP